MRNILKFISLFVITYLCITVKSIAQKSKTQREITQSIPKSPPDLKTPKPITFEFSEFEKNYQIKIKEAKIKAGNEKTEDILKYFINESENIKYFTFQEGTKTKSVTYRIDSLLPMFKERLDSFLIKMSPASLGFGEYVANGHIKEIKEKIDVEYAKPFKKRDKAMLKEIMDSISMLIPSKEKVDLVLQFASLTLENEIFFKIISQAYLISEKTAALITDPYEKSQGYLFIGNFAHWFKDEQKAMQMYYLGREWIQKSSISPQLKASEEGKFCQDIANLFLRRNDMYALEKAVDYFDEARFYFTQSGNIDYINSNWASQFANTAYLFSNFFYAHDTSLYTATMLEKTLNSLNFWYYYFTKGYYNSTINYKGFYSIAHILNREKKFYSSLVYYLRALSYAFNTNNETTIGQAISNVAYAYSLLNDKKMSKAYDDMRLDLAYHTDKSWDYNMLILNVADNFYYTKQYDSALYILNKIQFDTAIVSHLYPPFYEDLVIGVLKRKYSVLDSLKSDSARVYEQNYYSAKEILDMRYTILLENEAYGKQNRLQILRDNEYSIRVKETDSLKNVEMELKGTNTKLKRETSDLRNLNSSYSASLKRTKEFLESARDSVGYYSSSTKKSQHSLDSLQEIVATERSNIESLNREAEKLKAQNNEAERTRNFAIGIAGLALASLVPIGLRGRKLKKKNSEMDSLISQKEREAEEKDLGKKLAEQKLLNDTALGHDLLTQIEHIPDLIIQTKKAMDKPQEISIKFDDCLNYAEDVNAYFDSNFKLRGQLLNTLSREIEMSKMYARIWERIQGKPGFVEINTDGIPHDLLNSVELPKHNIVNFISNSFRHGGIGRDKIRIDVSVAKNKSNIVIIIQDNGAGFTDLKLATKAENRGLNLIVKQIENYNAVKAYPYIIEFTLKNIQNIIEDNLTQGVRVAYKLIKK